MATSKKKDRIKNRIELKPLRNAKESHIVIEGPQQKFHYLRVKQILLVDGGAYNSVGVEAYAYKSTNATCL